MRPRTTSHSLACQTPTLHTCLSPVSTSTIHARKRLQPTKTPCCVVQRAKRKSEVRTIHSRTPHMGLTANSELFEQVMDNLRREVRLLQENDLFEQTVLRGSLVTDEQQPSSDIDAIMRSMMGPPASVKDPFLPPSPSTARSNTLVFQDFAIHPVSATSSATATGTPRTKSKGKARRV